MAVRDHWLAAKNVSIYFPLGRKTQAVKPRADSPVGGHLVTGPRANQLCALDNISFELKSGDRLALMGHNGSGKTTLLRALAGIYHLRDGSIETNAEIGNALNINIGFRNEATGRRNIQLKGLIGGKQKEELDGFIEQVEDFAALGPYLDMPLRTYSMGMRARLSFGIATAFKYDVLLLDEWLGVGDQAMRERVHERMNELVGSSSILVLASHNEILLKQNCNLGLVLERGRKVFFGDYKEAAAIHSKMQAAQLKKANAFKSGKMENIENAGTGTN